MSNAKSNIIDETRKKENQQEDSIAIDDVSNGKVADFETAITIAGTGKFQYLLILMIIPASWASSIDTANMSMILAPAECDLELTLFDKGLLNAIIYIGMVLSGFIWGFLADVKGRKKIIIYGYMADGICNVLSGFSQNFEMLVFFKFISGLIVCGPYASLMAYCSEFYGEKGRKKVPIIVGFFVSFGNVLNAALAWLIVPQEWSILLWDGAFVYNSWRIFLTLCGVSSLIGVICLSFFPESPKFLMTQGRDKDALEVFKTIYSINTGLSKDSYPIHALSDTNAITEQSSVESQHNAKTLLKDGIQQLKPILSKPYLSLILLFVTQQFFLMLILNTIRLWQPQLFATIDNFNSVNHNNDIKPTFCEIIDITTANNANKTLVLEESNISTNCENTVVSDSMYLDTIIVSSTCSVFILSASIFVNFLQHKHLAFVGYGCALMCLIALIWSTSTLTTLVLTCLYLGLLNMTFNITIGATVLLFPTSLRTMAVSLQMILGRIGSMIGNLIFPILLEYGCIIPIITLICFCLLCILLTCFLPSIRKHAM